ncbi:MAG: hypothetical protein M3256_23020 [Actinomycetota bacterium]|nr:hypothetical protein [Actinomycetota bacterium]
MASSLLSQVSGLVAENKQLTQENRELRAIVDRVSQAVKGASGRRQKGSAETASGTGRPVGRPRRTRRKITDPATLERRRAALAKARKVLADRRAASKAS